MSIGRSSEKGLQIGVVGNVPGFRHFGGLVAVIGDLGLHPCPDASSIL